ncbi:GNAT family N-acetyltransferase [Pseudonocardia sp. TRM90224]|uniref:GNAT family N-acetyltransferase n=1 Tax=Pseudonocardia sp. TRM90224 TaxID=2812678 RepID=UPI001E40EA31|nr:GNAT family N-acetyltransferase [Pseudonocardia sp. TRM90224]
MAGTLLHLISPSEWRAALAVGAVAPPSLAEVGFVHLSTPEQVMLPAERLFAGRSDLMLLVLDPERIGVEVRWEPGVPSDPASMTFPHAYGPVPTSAVLAVLPYRPGPTGFEPPRDVPTDLAGRARLTEPSLLRRVASREVRVAGGVGVLLAGAPESYQHNQVLFDEPVDAGTAAAEADRVLGSAGLKHRWMTLSHPTAVDGLRELGWDVQEVAVLTKPTGGAGSNTLGSIVDVVDVDAARPMWRRMWRRGIPDVAEAVVDQLADRYLLEAEVVDLRVLGIRSAGSGSDDEVVASALLKIDGATAELDMVNTDPEHRGRGHGDALLAEALSLTGAAGCDVLALRATVADWPREWYLRRGFTEVTRVWSAGRD